MTRIETIDKKIKPKKKKNKNKTKKQGYLNRFLVQFGIILICLLSFKNLIDLLSVYRDLSPLADSTADAVQKCYPNGEPIPPEILYKDCHTSDYNRLRNQSKVFIPPESAGDRRWREMLEEVEARNAAAPKEPQDPRWNGVLVGLWLGSTLAFIIYRLMRSNGSIF